MVIVMKGIGKKIELMAMEYIIIGMVANIKDNGRMISKMG